MKIRQAKKLMLRTIDRMPKYWIGQIKKSNLTVGRGDTVLSMRWFGWRDTAKENQKTIKRERK